jgi:hypothetical protein
VTRLVTALHEAAASKTMHIKVKESKLKLGRRERLEITLPNGDLIVVADEDGREDAEREINVYHHRQDDTSCVLEVTYEEK